ncbi:g2314 [Coccomyxa elongata]
MTDLDNPHSWKLKGQGNANIVFAYSGNRQWLADKVLRVRKTAQNADTEAVILRPTESLESRVWSPLIPESISGASERQTAYEEAVLRQLLGAQYIHTGLPCNLSTEFAAALSAQLQSADTSLSCKAWLLPDHTVFRQCTLCVEIKPKCGFLPTSILIRPEHGIKHRVPRFQLHQQLKLAQGKIKHLSNYNPLDLFSGEPQRVEAAVAALFAEPQNNLKLFLDGSPMQSPQDDRLPSLELLPVVQQAGGVWGLIRLLRVILLREGVLDSILKVQKMDVHDIEGIHPLLTTLLQRHPPLSLSEDTPQCRQNAPCASIEAHMASPSGHKAPAGNTSGEHDAALKRLLTTDFETAAEEAADMTALTRLAFPDLQLTIAALRLTVAQKQAADRGARAPLVFFSRWQEDPSVGSAVQHGETGTWFRYKVAVVDLDLKPLSKVEQHFRLEQQILDCVLRTNGTAAPGAQ